MRTYAIADLHGRFDLLIKALRLIEEDAGAAGGKLVITGDFVDRGPQVKQIIDHLMAGPSSAYWEWVILQGNHEEMMIEVLRRPTASGFKNWMHNGGGQTMMSYGYVGGDTLDPLKIPEAHIAWLEGLPVYHEDQHRIFVHAGVPHDTPVEEAEKGILQWMLHEDDIDGVFGFPSHPHVSGKHIVHGHHQSETHPLLLPYRTNLDSFAWHSNRLAIGVFNDDQPQPFKIMDAIEIPRVKYAA